MLSGTLARYFPGDRFYERFVRVGSYTERHCINCGILFAFSTRKRKLDTCSTECAESARKKASGTTRKRMAEASV